MAETLENLGSGSKWHWYNVQSDLVSQGDLDSAKTVIDPLSVTDHGCGGDYNGNRFYITWLKDRFLLVSSQKYDQQLVDAFSKVVEYQPFAKYKHPETNLYTAEWDKLDPKGRYAKLASSGMLELVKL